MGKQNKQKEKKNVEVKEEDIPLEGTQEDFDHLLSQVKSLTSDEAKEELLECARYGEVDAVHAILDCFGDIVDTADDEGNTALHKTCANGHVSTTKVLLLRGASHCANFAGNTPLHWAASNGHDKAVRLLLENKRLKSNMDVLEKNSFGRSALTEGFTSKVTEVTKLLLEHDSASEERLLSGGQEVDVSDDEANGESKAQDHVLHDFDFRNIPNTQDANCEENIEKMKSKETLLIRELPIAHADNPFGEEAIEDTTGYGIWCASLAMARWMASPDMAERFSGKSVLELGAGCGVPGLAAAFYSKAERVYITDLNPTTVQNMQYNIDVNEERSSVSEGPWNQRVIASSIDWDDETTWPSEKIDFVIGSDLIYQSSIVPLLKKVVVGLLKPNEGRFLYVAPDTGRDGLDAFIESMKGHGCNLIEAVVAPQSYHANPLASQNDDQCFLHFHELASSTYILYEFQCT